MKLRFYFDMDGVLARWKDVSVEETEKSGYFRNLDPEPCIINAVLNMHDRGYDVSILSAVYRDGHSARDKYEWLKAQGLADIPRVFVPYGEKKADYIKANEINILVDDYSKNLHEWAGAGNVGIKFKNGINGTKGTWKGNSVSHAMSTELLVDTFIAFAEIAKTAASAT